MSAGGIEASVSRFRSGKAGTSDPNCQLRWADLSINVSKKILLLLIQKVFSTDDRCAAGMATMELHQVRYFLAVCETLNFSRAAEACHISQPALSRAIKQLEDELGGELLRRERLHTHITDLGHAILPSLRQCYDSNLAAKALAQDYLKGGHAPLNLALSRSIEIELISPVLSEIATAFPKIEIRIFRGSPSEVGEKLKNGETEIAVAGPLANDWERIDAHRLFDERFGLLISRKHPLAQCNRIELKSLMGERLLCRQNCAMTDVVVSRLKGAGMPNVSRHEVPLVADLTGLVRANFGIGILPMGRDGSENLRFTEIEGVDLARPINVYTVAGRRHSTAVGTLKTLLRARDWSTATIGAALYD